MKARAFFVILVVLLFCGCEYLPDIPALPTSPNEPPTACISAISSTEASTGETITFQGAGDDSDGTVVAYRWQSDIDGELSDEQNFEISSLSPGRHTITLSVQDNDGAWSEECSATVTISSRDTDLPIIHFFKAEPDMIVSGDSSVLSWDVSNATSLRIDRVSGDIEMSGSITVSLHDTAEYLLTATNAAGSVQSGVTIVVAGQGIPAGEKKVILHTTADDDCALVKYSSEYVKKDNPCVGDNDINLPSRAFLSFDISGIPSNAIIQEAILDLSNYTETGSPTYSTGAHGNMGALEIYFYQYGSCDNLDRIAYNRAAQIIAGGGIIEYPLSSWKLDVTRSKNGEQILQDLVSEGKLKCQFRMQFFTSTNWDGVADMFCFDEATLTIKYIVQ
jgi:PKD repeat protein